LGFRRTSPQALCLANRGAEQRPFATIGDARGPDVDIQIFFQFVVTGHFFKIAGWSSL
jgi:hypothetical protein